MDDNRCFGDCSLGIRIVRCLKPSLVFKSVSPNMMLELSGPLPGSSTLAFG